MHDSLSNTLWLGNSVKHWLITVAIIIVAYIIVQVAVKTLGSYLERWANRTTHIPVKLFAAIVQATRSWVLLLFIADLAVQCLHMTASAERALRWGMIALAGVQAALWLSKAWATWLKHVSSGNNIQKSNPVIFSLLTRGFELLIWLTLLLVLLSQAGVHIGAFIASLGVGGIAIAMAAQHVLQDLLASVAIGLDKPFTEGDFIAFGNNLGTINKVGIKSTRIQSLSGEELSIGNASLLQQLSHNYNRMQERRITFDFYVPLDTPREKVETIVQAANNIIINQPGTRFDRGHFIGIEPDGFKFSFVYYMLNPAFGAYCDTQQTINFELMRKLEELNVDFAMPTRKIYSDNKTMH